MKENKGMFGNSFNIFSWLKFKKQFFEEKNRKIEKYFFTKI